VKSFTILCLQEMPLNAGKDWRYFALQGALQCALSLPEKGDDITAGRRFRRINVRKYTACYVNV
jgi:hypothetical protein